MANRPLGSTQKSFMKCMRKHKFWSANCGWYWRNWSTTVSLLNGLIKRGLVRITDRDGKDPLYELTEKGKKLEL